MRGLWPIFRVTRPWNVIDANENRKIARFAIFVNPSRGKKALKNLMRFEVQLKLFFSLAGFHNAQSVEKSSAC